MSSNLEKKHELMYFLDRPDYQNFDSMKKMNIFLINPCLTRVDILVKNFMEATKHLIREKYEFEHGKKSWRNWNFLKLSDFRNFDIMMKLVFSKIILLCKVRVFG